MIANVRKTQIKTYGSSVSSYLQIKKDLEIKNI